MSVNSSGSAPTVRDAAVLAFTSSLGPFAVNTYIPGFYIIAEEYGVTLPVVQQSLTLYLMAFAIGTLFCGALSDTFGRRRVLLNGMILFALASIGAMTSPNIYMLFFWRVVQGLGAAVGQVVTQAIVRDRWAGLHATRVNGLIAMFFAVSPALSPVIGGEIIVLFQWQAAFAFLALYALSIALVVVLWLPESLPAHARQPLRLRSTFANYGHGLTHKAFMAGALSHGCLFMGGIIYTAGAADFVINIMQFGVDEFIWLTAPLICFSVFGSWCCTHLIRRFGQGGTMAIGLALMILPGLIATVTDYVLRPGYPWIILGPAVYQIGMHVCRPVMMVMNLDYFPNNRGMASSIQQFFVTTGFAFCCAFLAPLAIGQAWKYSLIMGICAVIVALLWLYALKARAACWPETARG